MLGSRLNILAHIPSDFDGGREELMSASSPSGPSPPLLDEVISGPNALDSAVLARFREARVFSSVACLIVGSSNVVDKAILRLMSAVAHGGVFEGDDGGAEDFSAQLLSQPVPQGTSVGFNSLKRADVVLGGADLTSISGVTSLSLSVCGRRLHVIVSEHVSPSSLALLRSSSRGMVILQPTSTGDEAAVVDGILSAASDLRLLCEASRTADDEHLLATLSSLASRRDPTSVLKSYFEGTAMSSAVYDHLSRLVELLPSTPSATSDDGHLKGIMSETGDATTDDAVIRVRLGDGNALGDSVEEKDYGAQPDVLNETMSARPPPDEKSVLNSQPQVGPLEGQTEGAAQEVEALRRHVSSTSRSVGGGNTEWSLPQRRGSTVSNGSGSRTSSTQQGVQRVTSYIPPVPFRTEVVLESTGW